MIFLDTSVIYAAADRSQPDCDRANALFAAALASGQGVGTHNYVVVEAVALLHRRLGRSAAVRFLGQVGLLDEVVWIDQALHDAAAAEFAKRPGRKVSLVDRVSFAVMRARKLTRALAFDDDFRREGFVLYDGR